MKVPFYDKRLWLTYAKLISASSVVISLLLGFIDFEQKTKIIIASSYMGCLVLLFLLLWGLANKMNRVSLKINNSTVNIFYGDIFKAPGYKVIGFNEYFDTQVDNQLLSDKTLNGQYIKANGRETVEALLLNDARIKDGIVEEGVVRTKGKTTRYRLGTICQANDYFLVAFSHFDQENKAYLTLRDYASCLLNMWNEIDQLYNGETVSLPLLGSGITRFKDCDVSDQELLEIIIWTLKISKVKFAYPSKLNIVLYQGKNRLNLYRLKEEE